MMNAFSVSARSQISESGRALRAGPVLQIEPGILGVTSPERHLSVESHSQPVINLPAREVAVGHLAGILRMEQRLISWPNSLGAYPMPVPERYDPMHFSRSMVQRYPEPVTVTSNAALI
jgi:hypothetical protein